MTTVLTVAASSLTDRRAHAALAVALALVAALLLGAGEAAAGKYMP